MSAALPSSTSGKFPSKELRSDLKQRVQVLFPYLKHISPCNGVTTFSLLQMFQKELHPELEVFMCEDIVLNALVCFRLMKAGGNDPTKEQLDVAVAGMQLP